VQRSETPGRERILRRIRSALSVPASIRPSTPAAPIFASVPDPIERFRRECEGNHTECVVTCDIAASSGAVTKILASIPPGEIFLQDAPVLRRLAAAWTAGRSLRWSGEGPPKEATQATITLAESLVAATGSVFVSAGCGGRSASIVAPVHIVVATAAQLAPTLATAFEWMSARGTTKRNSMVSLITGPSRTGDIEKILVMGAHGPQRLFVVLAMHGE
jgi:L-lactate dehydrogenase complex protein LldG